MSTVSNMDALWEISDALTLPCEGPLMPGTWVTAQAGHVVPSPDHPFAGMGLGMIVAIESHPSQDDPNWERHCYTILWSIIPNSFGKYLCQPLTLGTPERYIRTLVV